MSSHLLTDRNERFVTRSAIPGAQALEAFGGRSVEAVAETRGRSAALANRTFHIHFG